MTATDDHHVVVPMRPVTKSAPPTSAPVITRTQKIASTELDAPARTSRHPPSYGSCSSLSRLWCLVGVGVPPLVGLLGSVLVASAP